MTERKKELLFLAALLVLLIICFSHILFTGRIIRAPDITNEYYWHVLDIVKQTFWSCFYFAPGSAGWDMLTNSGTSLGGGTNSSNFLNLRNLIYHVIPPPTSVAWFIVLHLFFGAAGIYCYCRLIGASRLASFLGGLIFAVAPENASLINAGHVMKIATISFAPWAFYFFEKGFQTRRPFFFLTTGLVLAFQFFNIHWQIAYYTCLFIGAYGIVRTIGICASEKQAGQKVVWKLLGLNLVVMFFFLSSVAISLAPLADWAKDTNRGANSGANVVADNSGNGNPPKAKGGLNREEAMSWSLPPEELAALFIPGMFGFSRQEGGENPANIASYYWGRMIFTQTVSYMGLLPWLLLPLPFIFRRDQFTWLALGAVVVGILFSMGKYTPFYNFLFDYFPGINRFRVPKMIMFIPVMGLGVLAARGLDILQDEQARSGTAFKRYIIGIIAVPVGLLLLLGAELIGRDYWISSLYEMLVQPTRYEQGPQLVMQRWNNLVTETAIAGGLAALFAAAFFAFHKRWVAATVLPVILIVLFLADVGRVNSKFMFLIDAPHRARGVKNPDVEFLARESKQYRVLPFDGDPMQYASNGIPVMFTSNAVQQRRWQEFLDTFNYASGMPDMLNVKYLIYGTQQYLQEKERLGQKYVPVFTTPDGGTVIVENRSVLPKAWLVPAAVHVPDLEQKLGALQHPAFDPRQVALVESPPPVSLADLNTPVRFPPQNVVITTYEGERIALTAKVPQNALLVLGEKYYRGWKATVDGTATEIHPVNHVLRGIYLTPGDHRVEFVFDPLPFKVGKWLTLMSFAFFGAMLGREVWLRKRASRE